jgi:hypothetical protein
MKEPERQQTKQHPSLIHLFTSFLRLGAAAFGGPAMVAYIRKMAVDQKHWMDEKTARDGSVSGCCHPLSLFHHSLFHHFQHLPYSLHPEKGRRSFKKIVR